MTEKLKMVAALACRNAGSRLYAKPLQRLGDKMILQHMIDQLHEVSLDPTFQQAYPFDLPIVLGISEGIENLVFQDIAKKNHIGFIIGSEEDVQFRLLQCAHLGKADIILRLTTESPFTAWEYFPVALRTIIEEKWDLVTIRHLPDGSSFELISYNALKRAHDQGNDQTRNELCTKYFFTHPDEFKIKALDAKPEHQKPHYRLTVDYADDLVICNRIFTSLSKNGKFPSFDIVIKYINQHPELMDQLAWIDGTAGRSLVDINKAS